MLFFVLFLNQFFFYCEETVIDSGSNTTTSLSHDTQGVFIFLQRLFIQYANTTLIQALKAPIKVIKKPLCFSNQSGSGQPARTQASGHTSLIFKYYIYNIFLYII